MKKTKVYIMIIISLFLIKGNYIMIKGASANIEISTDLSEVRVGDEIVVAITIKSDDFIGDFETNLTYDSEILELISASSAITGGNGFLRIAANNASEGSKEVKMGIKFKGISPGISDVGFTGRIMVFNFETGEEMPVSSEVLSVKVREQATASTNNYLKKLKIKPEGLEPEFNKNIFEYNIKVANDTESLIINAIPEDDKAKTMVVGDKHLVEGDNKVVITVKAESGEQKEYIINVEKMGQAETKLDINPYDEFISGIELVKHEDDTYIMLKNKYRIIELTKDEIIPTGYVKSQLSIGNVTVQSFSPEDDLDSRFILLYGMNNDGEEGFYQYDRDEKTFQRYIEDELDEEYKEVNTDNDKELNEYKNNILTLRKIVAVLILAVVILSITTVIKIRKKH